MRWSAWQTAERDREDRRNPGPPLSVGKGHRRRPSHDACNTGYPLHEESLYTRGQGHDRQRAGTARPHQLDRNHPVAVDIQEDQITAVGMERRTQEVDRFVQRVEIHR